MLNPLSAEQEAKLKDLIEQYGLNSVQEHIWRWACNVIALTWCEDDGNLIGGSRLGGLPDLPPHIEWPEGMEFLGQINLEEVAPHGHNNLLPHHGLLNFFLYQDWDESHQLGLLHRVIFTEQTNELIRASAPKGFLPVGMSEQHQAVYNSHPVKPQSFISLPRTWPYSSFHPDPPEISAELQESYRAMVETLPKIESKFILASDNSIMEASDMEDAWEIIAKMKGEAEDIDAYRDPALGLMNEWALLLSMDSCSALGTLFWDGGTAYFTMRRRDMAERRFDLTFAGIQTG